MYTGSSRTTHGTGSSSSKISRHPSGSGFEIYGDTSTPGIMSKATGQIRNIPLDPSINQENTKQMGTLKGAKVQFFIFGRVQKIEDKMRQCLNLSSLSDTAGHGSKDNLSLIEIGFSCWCFATKTEVLLITV